jgi:hypothetical protein
MVVAIMLDGSLERCWKDRVIRNSEANNRDGRRMLMSRSSGDIDRLVIDQRGDATFIMVE